MLSKRELLCWYSDNLSSNLVVVRVRRRLAQYTRTDTPPDCSVTHWRRWDSENSDRSYLFYSFCNQKRGRPMAFISIYYVTANQT